MSKHSVAEAKNRLPSLIDRAIKGEEVVITRHGRPVAELRAIPVAAKPITAADIDWLIKHRPRGVRPKEDAGTLVSRMRDEDWK